MDSLPDIVQEISPNDFPVGTRHRRVDHAREAVSKAMELLEVFPFPAARPQAQGAESSPFLRELIIPFGHSGYVSLFEVEDSQTVTVLAVLHQQEEDYL